MKKYNVYFSAIKPGQGCDWDSPLWNGTETAELNYIRPESSEHFPEVRVKLLHSSEGISGIFLVKDNYVVCRRSLDMDSIWNDSCVEFFIKPGNVKGYFNFEFNCIGRLYASYIIDHQRTEGGFKNYIPFSREDCAQVERSASLKELIINEITEPLDWTLQFYIPYSILEKFAGKRIEPENCEWRGNFYKCADESSHPHWVCWSRVNELNFHAPESFGKLVFTKNKI